jgi:hypothetical protein
MAVKGCHMAELIYQFPDPVRSTDDVLYVVQVWAEHDDHRWHGWLVFVAADGRILRTARETTQASRDAMYIWTVGLRPIYLDGALTRAVPPSAETSAA